MIQCCVFPDKNKQQLLQFNSLWSSFIKNVYGILKNNQKKKVKAWSCKCMTSDVQINDLCLVCKLLFYDHQNTLHTAITWYVHSTSFSLHDNETNSSLCEEWGQVNDTFYEWPLYKCCSSDEEDNNDDDLIGNFMHRYFDGDFTIKSDSLLAQLPKSVIDSLWGKIVPLTTSAFRSS